MAELFAVPHLPEQAPIEAYGNGGFRFAGMSHRGSLLCLPAGSGRGRSVKPVKSISPRCRRCWPPRRNSICSCSAPAAIRGSFRRTCAAAFSEAGLGIDAMPTGAAVRHLQHPPGGTPPDRGGSDRCRVMAGHRTDPNMQEAFRSLRGAGARGRQGALFATPVRARPTVAPHCLRSMPSMRNCRGCAIRCASRCRGNPAAMVERCADGHGARRCRRQSGGGRAAGDRRRRMVCRWMRLRRTDRRQRRFDLYDEPMASDGRTRHPYALDPFRPDRARGASLAASEIGRWQRLARHAGIAHGDHGHCWKLFHCMPRAARSSFRPTFWRSMASMPPTFWRGGNHRDCARRCPTCGRWRLAICRKRQRLSLNCPSTSCPRCFRPRWCGRRSSAWRAQRRSVCARRTGAMATPMDDVACGAQAVADRGLKTLERKRSRRLRRSSTMRSTMSFSASLVTSGSIRSTWFRAIELQNLGARLRRRRCAAVRRPPAGVRGAGRRRAVTNSRKVGARQAGSPSTKA